MEGAKLLSSPIIWKKLKINTEVQAPQPPRILQWVVPNNILEIYSPIPPTLPI